MLEQVILAVPTYGSQRVKSPRTYQIVSAYKLGYTSAARDVLLAIFGDQAEDVTSKRATYHYVQIHTNIILRHGYLLAQISATDVSRIEALTKHHHSPRIYRWQDGAWSEMPSLHQADYTPVTVRGRGPDFNPTKLFGTTSQEQGITIEKSQRGNGAPWWWIRGDTYPHKEMLKRWGCRWSKRNKAWYFIGEHLPQAVHDLASPPDDPPPPSTPAVPADDAPCSVQEAEQILGVKLAVPDVNPMKHRHAMPSLELGQQVWSAHEMTVTPTDTIPMATEGKIVARYIPERQEAYKVDFGEYGVHTVFGKNISDYNTLLAGVTRKETVELFNAGPAEDPYQVARERRQSIATIFALLDELPDEKPPETLPETPATQEDISSQHIPEATLQPQYKLGQQVWSQGFIAMTNGQVVGRDATCYITHIYDIRHIDFNIKGDHYQPKNIAYAIQATLADEPLLPRQLYAFEYELRAEQPPIPTMVQTVLSPEMQHQAKQRRQLQTEDRAKIESLGIQIHPVPETPSTQEDTSSVYIPEEEALQHIRIIEPTELPEHLQTAIQSARSAPMVHRVPTTTHKQQSIGQAFCGELSGDITGNVQCFGYAIHEGVLVYLNMGGPKMACEAIRAKLSKAQAVNLHFDDAPSMELTPGENNTGMYEAFGQYIKEARYTNLILVHEMVTEPNYGGKSTTFIFRTSDEQLIAKLKHHITELVNVPVFDAWADYLWQAGQSAMLVRKTRSGGDIDLWTVDLDADSWSRLITGGLEMNMIHLAT
jgi:hypothetical protein